MLHVYVATEVRLIEAERLRLQHVGFGSLRQRKSTSKDLLPFLTSFLKHFYNLWRQKRDFKTLRCPRLMWNFHQEVDVSGFSQFHHFLGTHYDATANQRGHHEFVRPVGDKLWWKQGGKIPEATQKCRAISEFFVVNLRLQSWCLAFLNNITNIYDATANQRDHHEFVQPVGDKLWCKDGRKIPETTPKFALSTRQIA